MATASVNILLVEDDADVNAAIREILAHEGIAVVVATSLAEARVCLANVRVAGVVLDYALTDGTADELLDELVASRSTAGVVLVSAHPLAIQIAKHYGIAFLKKPFDLDVLVAAVHVLLEGKGQPMLGRHGKPRPRLTPA